MDTSAYLNMFLMLALVVSLIYAMAYILKKVKSPIFGNRDGLRLKIVENLPIDAKRRLVLITKDSEELLILLSPNGDTIINFAGGDGQKTMQNAMQSPPKKPDGEGKKKGAFQKLLDKNNE